MIQEERLLLTDLCGRLPYGVKCKHKFSDYKEVLNGIKYENAFCYFTDCEPCLIEDIKPYLFPLSSMTEEQKIEYNRLKHEIPVLYYEYGDVVEKVDLFDSPESYEYLIENHFDYRGLIEKGLAIDCTNLNVY